MPARAVALLAVLAAATWSASASAAPGALSLHGPVLVAGGRAAALTGTATGLPPWTHVLLYRTAPYPARKLLRVAVTGENGSFGFTVHPDRTTRFLVSVPRTSLIAQTTVKVADPIRVSAHPASLGRAVVGLVVAHPADLRWSGARVRWTFISRGGRRLAVRSSRTMRRSSTVTALRILATLPAGSVRWQVCFTAPGDTELADPRRPRGCSGWGDAGTVRLPDGYPGSRAISHSISYLNGRTGRTAMAVVDSEGRIHGWHMHWRFVSASVVKAMLLVAYLRRLAHLGDRSVPASASSFLYPMIHESDNGAATTTWSIVGDGGLYDIAHRARMTDYSVVGDWAQSQISAADQARFFFEMDSLIPREFVGYARHLLSTIAPDESWGIPAVARRLGYAVFFKGGWRGTSLGQLVHQVGRLERRSATFSLAVMTDGDPSMGYGINSIQGVTARLL